MLFLLATITCIMFREMKNGQYLKVNSKKILETTRNLEDASDFKIEPRNGTTTFIVTDNGSKNVWDDPGRSHGGFIYMGRLHAKQNQLISFHLNRNGSLTPYIRGKPMVFLESLNMYKVEDSPRDDQGLVIVDKGTPYSDFFKEIPVEQMSFELQNPQRKDLFEYEHNDTDLKSKLFGQVLKPQTHLDRLSKHISLPRNSHLTKYFNW